MKKVLSFLGMNAGDIAWSITGFSGLVSIGYGAWLIYHPAGFIVGGVLAVGASALAMRGA